MAANWIDLLDPTAEELRAAGAARARGDRDRAARSPHPRHDDEPRPTLQGHGDYVFGIFLLARAMPDEDCIYYQEIGLVLTHDTLLTVRKTPADGRRALRHRAGPRRRARDRLGRDDRVPDRRRHRREVPRPRRRRRRRDRRARGQGRRAVGGETREPDLRRCATTCCTSGARSRRCATRSGASSTTSSRSSKGTEVFPHDVEVAFNSAYDKLLRALDGLELSRDLLASVRDYHQSKIANDQNEVTKRLTVIASLILFPTFIVGVYGQNFVHMPELHWHYGYAYSWGLIVATTLVQLWWFRRKRWL